MNKSRSDLVSSAEFQRAIAHYKLFMKYIGVNFDTPDTERTPERVILMYQDLFSSVGRNLEIVEDCVNDDRYQIKLMQFDKYNYDQLIVIQNIPFASFCSHHHVPFLGKGYIGYLPGEGLLGLSKTARVLEFFSHRPQSQEELTEDVCNFIYNNVKPKFVIVVLKAEHLCMTIRGAKKPGSITSTSKILCKAMEDEQINTLKGEFFKLIKL